MKKTKPIKERLNNHREMLEKLKALQTELEFAEKQFGAPRSTNLTGMPGGKGYNGTSETEAVVIRKIELETKVKRQQEKIDEDWAELEPLIEQLKPVVTLVINLRYRYGGEWSDVCKGLYGRRHDYETELDSYMNRTFKTHGRALLTLSEMFENSDGTPTEL